MKVVIYIGNRINSLRILLQRKDRYFVKKIFVLENSPLFYDLQNEDIEFTTFLENLHYKNIIVNFLTENDFDLLISNGCPFLMPKSLFLNKYNALFINTHPTYLPHLRGKTPLNGVFYLNYEFVGATTHYMNEEVDKGNIIHQKKINLTNDIDQGLVYFLSFQLEKEVFEEALNILEDNLFLLKGKKQTELGSIFNRKKSLFNIDFYKDSEEEILKKVRSVGINTQGAEIIIEDLFFKVFEANILINPYILNFFKDKKPGQLLLKYSNKILIKTINGIIRFSYI